jgi:hypothetical protein
MDTDQVETLHIVQIGTDAPQTVQELIAKKEKLLEEHNTLLEGCHEKIKQASDKKDELRKQLNAASSAVRKELYEKRQVYKRIIALKFAISNLQAEPDKTKIVSDDIFTRCVRLTDISGISHKHIGNIRLREQKSLNYSDVEFTFTQKDMEDIKRRDVLKNDVTVKDIEDLVASVPIDTFEEKVKELAEIDLKTLRGYTTGTDSETLYHTFTGYGYVIRMLQFLHKFRCIKCEGITHKNHSCERTFVKFPQRVRKEKVDNSDNEVKEGDDTVRSSRRSRNRGNSRNRSRNNSRNRGNSRNRNHRTDNRTDNQVNEQTERKEGRRLRRDRHTSQTGTPAEFIPHQYMYSPYQLPVYPYVYPGPQYTTSTEPAEMKTTTVITKDKSSRQNSQTARKTKSPPEERLPRRKGANKTNVVKEMAE